MSIFESFGFWPVICKNADSFPNNYLLFCTYAFGDWWEQSGFLRDMLPHTVAPFCCFINLYCRLGLLHTSLCDMRIGVGNGDKLQLRLCQDKVKNSTVLPGMCFFILTKTENVDCIWLYVSVWQKEVSGEQPEIRATSSRLHFDR